MNDNITIPPTTMVVVNDEQTPLLYDAKNRPLTRQVGFRVGVDSGKAR